MSIVSFITIVEPLGTTSLPVVKRLENAEGMYLEMTTMFKFRTSLQIREDQTVVVTVIEHLVPTQIQEVVALYFNQSPLTFTVESVI